MLPAVFRLPDVVGSFEMRIGLPRPNWPLLYELAESVSAGVELHVVWTEIAANWVGRLAKTLGDLAAVAVFSSGN